jgi:hypothetical protein
MALLPAIGQDHMLAAQIGSGLDSRLRENDRSVKPG